MSCDMVLDLAALIGIPYSYFAPASYLATNAGGTLNVLEACRQAKTSRGVVTSTSEVYGTALYIPSPLVLCLGFTAIYLFPPLTGRRNG